MTQQTQICPAPTPPAPLVLMKLIHDVWPVRCIHVAAQFGIADQLKDGPKRIAELAEATGTHAPSLHRLLRALAQIGIFTEVEPEYFANTDLSTYLRSDLPGSMYALARMVGAESHWQSWGKLAYSIQTGEPAFDKIYGMTMWRYFAEQNPAEGAFFGQAMTAFSESVNLPIAQAYDFSGVRTLIDVGGGHGSLLRTILTTYPRIETGILFDQPQVIAEAEAHVETAHLTGRCRLVAGDFFKTVPEEADIYLLKQILHDWNDEQCVRILTNCRKAMRPGGRVLAAELMLQPDSPNPFPYFLDLELLACQTGRERTADEFRALYDAAGLRLTRIIPTASMSSLIEGMAIDE